MNQENRMKNYIIMAENFELEENPIDAILKYRKAMEFAISKEEKIVILFRIALLSDEIEEYKKAVSTYDEIIEIDENRAGAYYGKAIAFEKLGEYEDAISQYNLAIEFNPYYNKAYYYLATLYDKMDNVDLAIKNYKQAILVDSKDYVTYNDLAGIYEELEDYKKAYNYVNKSIEICDDYYRSYYNKGVIEGRMGNFIGAIEAYKKSIELNPSYGNNFLNISAIYLEDEKYNETIDILTDGILYNKDDTNLYYNRACAYSLLNRDEEAIRDMEKAIELYPIQEFYARRDNDLKRLFKD